MLTLELAIEQYVSSIKPIFEATLIQECESDQEYENAGSRAGVHPKSCCKMSSVVELMSQDKVARKDSVESGVSSPSRIY